jgi:uncharacterized sulfatase
MVGFIDIVPLAIEVAGGKPPADLDGKSFLAVLEGKAPEHHDCIFGTYSHAAVSNSGGEFPIRSARTRTHKYIRNFASGRTFTNNITASAEDIRFWPSWEDKARTDAFAAARVNLYQHRPPEELYDLRSDPYELKNLAADPAQKEVLAAMRKRLDDWMKQQGDTGQVGDAPKKGGNAKKGGGGKPAAAAADNG